MNYWLIGIGIIGIAATVVTATLISFSPRFREASRPVTDRLPAPARTPIQEASDQARTRRGKHRAGATR